ncbi:MAG: SpoIIE family protein phosphatase [Desulfobacterales bacterium]|nr:SpoIIE family protein phosphatase [Desulfobacterales bacterium]
MNAWTRFRLKNSMLTAMVGANLISGLSMDLLIIQGDAPPPPAILRLATFLDLTFIPIVFAVAIVFIIRYERPIRRYLNRQEAGEPISGKLTRKARRRLLNEPYMLLMMSWSLWLYGTILYTGIFWFSGAGPIEIHRALFRSLSTGLTTVVVAFFLLESILQKWLAPVFFPEGGLSQTSRVMRMQLSVRLGCLLLACNVVPLLSIVGATLRIVSVAKDQHELAAMIRRAVIFDAVVFMLVGAFLVFIVSRNITQSMGSIIRVLKQIRRGNFDHKVRVTANDEIGYAGDVINTMTEGLKERDAMRHSLALAREVQQRLLPRVGVLTNEALQIAGRSVYCDETGGDYFDFFAVARDDSRQMAFALGDVSGHGIASALLMATVRSALRQRAALPGDPARIVQDVNAQLVADVQESGQFMTLFFFLYAPDNRMLQWVRAGHDPALLYDPTGDRFETLRGEGIALGLDGDYAYRTNRRVDIKPGQILVVGTDGVWESRNTTEEMFGKERVRDLVRRHAGRDAHHIREVILAAVKSFMGDRRAEDDITLMVVKLGA